jgi:hypothetical protein
MNTGGTGHSIQMVGGPAWHVVGGAATALGTGAAPLASVYVLGGSVMQDLWTNQGVGLIGPVSVPTVLAITSSRSCAPRPALYKPERRLAVSWTGRRSATKPLGRIMVTRVAT